MNNICFVKDSTLISLNDFLADIHLMRQTIKPFNQQNILLFNADSYLFTVQFFALILEQKHVLLPPNHQQGTLNELSNLCDATLGNIKIQGKESISTPEFSLSNLVNSERLNIEQTLLLTRTELFDKLEGKITFFTSGSTGSPKAIVKQCWQLKAEINTLLMTFSKSFDSAELVFSTVSHQHIYGLLFKILLPLKSGLTIVNDTFEYPEHIVEQIAQITSSEVSSIGLNKSTPKALLISSPAHLKRLVMDNVLMPIKHRFIETFSSGGPLSFETSKLFNLQMIKAPIEVFGSTETGGIAWRCCQSEQPSSWQVFKGIKFRATEQDNRLEVNSPYLDETNYLTDDIIELIDESHFTLLGRIDRTIKLEEKRINLTHLEEYLCTHPWVNEVRCLLLESGQQRQILGVIVEITTQAQNLIDSKNKRTLNELLKTHLLSQFERICLPKKWRYVERFPYNSQGKIVLKKLESMFE